MHSNAFENRRIASLMVQVILMFFDKLASSEIKASNFPHLLRKLFTTHCDRKRVANTTSLRIYIYIYISAKYDRVSLTDKRSQMTTGILAIYSIYRFNEVCSSLRSSCSDLRMVT